MQYIQNIIEATTVNNAMIIMIGAIVLDLISGVIKALYEGTFKSGNLRKGLYKKMEWVVMMLFAALVYLLTGIKELPYGLAGICAATEFMSMIENGIQMGLITKSWVTKFFGVSPDELTNTSTTEEKKEDEQ